jgi:hypothetical protein
VASSCNAGRGIVLSTGPGFERSFTLCPGPGRLETDLGWLTAFLEVDGLSTRHRKSMGFGRPRYFFLAAR